METVQTFGRGGALIQSERAALSLDTVRVRVPSVFTREAHPDRSADYRYMSTADIIQPLYEQGYGMFEARQSGARDALNIPYRRHMVRMRQTTGLRQVGDSLPEVIITNSHDGGSAWRFMVGVFRLVCSNGLILGTGFCDVRVKHSGHALDEVRRAFEFVQADLPRVGDAIRAFEARQLSSEEQEEFAMRALVARFGAKQDGSPNTIMTPAHALRHRRYDDQGPDLWRTLNRVQENLVRGGQEIQPRDSNGFRNGRLRVVRGVKSVGPVVDFNRALWNIASELAA